jgi:hypothetical protein
VSLTLPWPGRLCFLRVLCASFCYKLYPFQAHWRKWPCIRIFRPVCLFAVHVGSGSSLLSCGVFLPPPLTQAFPLLVARCAPPLPPEPLQPAGLLYLQFREGFPFPPLWSSGCPTLFASCLYCSYCLLLSLSFFSRVGVCPGGYGDLAQGCLWKCRIPLSSPCPRLPKLSGCGQLAALGALLVSPFNMK